MDLDGTREFGVTFKFSKRGEGINVQLPSESNYGSERFAFMSYKNIVVKRLLRFASRWWSLFATKSKRSKIDDFVIFYFPPTGDRT